MLKQKVSLAFLDLLAAKKIPFAANIINCLTNNKAFPDLPVPVEMLTTLNDALSAALQNLQDGGKRARAEFNASLSDWDDAFENTANYISLLANGNTQVIANSGFNFTKGIRQSVPTPGGAVKFEAHAARATGCVAVSCEADTTSHGYITFATPDEGVTITQTGNQLAITAGGVTTYMLVHTRSKGQFENLPTGKPLYLSMLIFNASGAGPLTNGQQSIPQ